MPSFAFLDSVWNETSMKTTTTSPVVDGTPAKHMGMTEGVDTRHRTTIEVPDVPDPKPRARASHAKMNYDRRMDPSKRPLVGRVQDRADIMSKTEKEGKEQIPLVADEDEVPELSVKIRHPKIVEYLEAYKDEYRVKVVEDMLLKSLKGSSFWDILGSNGKEMFMGEDLSPRERNVQMLMYLWIGIAVALFFLLITSG